MPTLMGQEQTEYSTLFPEAQQIYQESQQNFASQTAFAQALQNNYNTQFAGQQGILQTITNSLAPIVNAGPSQFGFSPAETQALMNQAAQGTSQAYQQSAKALGEQQAAQSGGVFLPSGAAAQQQAQLAAQAAQTQSNQQMGVLTSGYQQGNQNYNAAISGMTNAAQVDNPASAATAALSGLSGASSSLGTGANSLASVTGASSGALSALSGFTGAATQSGSAAQSGLNSAFGSATTVQNMNNASSPLAIAGGILGDLSGPASSFLSGGLSSMLNNPSSAGQGGSTTSPSALSSLQSSTAGTYTATNNYGGWGPTT